MTGYLFHIDPPLHHARHYLGTTDDLPAREARHRAGEGSPLLRAALAAGSTITVVRTWDGVDRSWERRVKRGKSSPRLCPICQERSRKKDPGP